MRYVQAFLLLAFLVAIGVFAAQNTGAITVSFLTWHVTQPVAFLTVAVYVLGMMSGWAVLGIHQRIFPPGCSPSRPLTRASRALHSAAARGVVAESISP